MTKSHHNVMVDLIAIDLAILPPPRISKAALRLSAGLPEAEFLGLRLDATHLPHITLTQQFVAATELPPIEQTVESVVRLRVALPLRVIGPGRGSRSVWMRIERTVELDALHRDLMDAVAPFEQRGGDGTAFVGVDARPRDVKWVSGYRASSGYGRYNPHITLGHARQLPQIEPIDFAADTIALCRLGRFCSCRQVLRSWRLPVP